ncbi:MAG: hypothetical protein JRE23_17845 [Deltaproteobacteria bacterium]|nr:hypothetical protein [Deltaproteobacteria bacterium]
MKMAATAMNEAAGIMITIRQAANQIAAYGIHQMMIIVVVHCLIVMWAHQMDVVISMIIRQVV